MRALRPTFSALVLALHSLDKRRRKMRMRALGLGALTLALAVGLNVGSASAAPLPFFYLVPTGPTTLPTVVPAGTSTYQLLVDPSVINTPGCTTFPPGQGLPTCVGTYAEEGTILAEGSLTMTAFSPITGAPAFTVSNLTGPTQLRFVTGDSINGNSVPFEIGTMTIANSGAGAGDITLVNGATPAQYTDAKFNTLSDTTPQVLAVADPPVPEPGALLLFGAGFAGLAAAVRARRPRML